MASDIFAKLGDIKGESLDDKHKDEIEVLSYSWGVTNAGSMASGSGGAEGKASVHDLSFTHNIDKASPVLMQVCANGTHMKEATITDRKAGKLQREFMVIKLNDVIITGVTHGGGGGHLENVSLAFAKVAIEMSMPPEKLSSVFPSLSSAASILSSATSTNVARSDRAAYFSSMSAPTTRQLQLQERTVSILASLRYDNATSRASTAVALKSIQAELGRLGPTLTLTSMRAPGALAQVGAMQATAIRRLSVAIGEFADGLTAEASARVALLERARALALQAEAESRKSAALASAVQNGVGAAAIASIPFVGPLIGAALAAAAAVIALMGNIVAKSKEDEAAAQEQRARQGTRTRSHGTGWPP